MQKVLTGLEVLQKNHSQRVSHRRIGLVAHPASVDANLRHCVHLLKAMGADIKRLFGPEHGFAGEAQDMESVEGEMLGPLGIPLTSLYGATEETLSPGRAHLANLDALVVDLSDVGSRYYTFVWTAVLCLRVCHDTGVEMILLDRPNPIGGATVEGAPQQEGYLSFVGLCPVANRHGMTVGELVSMVAAQERLTEALTVIPMEGWTRQMMFADTGLPWVLPSPNMPTPETALVYPGGCLLEATGASEGRGTTRPFELFGAPGVDPQQLVQVLTAQNLPGTAFRPVSFKPTFQKHAGVICGGAQLHVTNPRAFRPYRTGVGILLALKATCPQTFSWRADPYEFVTDIPAIDLLTGSDAVRKGIEVGAALQDICNTWSRGESEFAAMSAAHHLYGR